VVEKDFLRVTLVCDDSRMEAHSVEHRLYCPERIGELVKILVEVKIQCWSREVCALPGWLCRQAAWQIK
jgi:hypothetical protein